MPHTNESTFRVRHYECDAYGHLNHANYLRYMQEAAFEASAAAGYDVARYQALNRVWYVRESDITYLRPLAYGDSVKVKTWVSDFRRIRSRRSYDLHDATSGELAAQAITDWVFLDAGSLRPITVPPEIVAAYWPDGPPDEVPPREAFPKAPDPPPGVFTMRRPVRWRDIDGAGHVNNAAYMAYFEDSGVEVAAAHGWPMTRMMEAGFGIIARRYRIEYRLPAFLGDELEVSTWISDPRRVTVVRHYTVSRVTDGALLARAHVLWVWVNLDSGKPVRIPAYFMDDFADNIVRK
jgi:acyl-CoA thioester hydrolase